MVCMVQIPAANIPSYSTLLRDNELLWKENAGLRVQVDVLTQQVGDLMALVGDLRDEIRKLRGDPGRPDMKPAAKPSGMEKGTDPKGPGKKREGRGPARTRREPTVRTIEMEPPEGAVSAGYTEFLHQDLRVEAISEIIRRRMWRLPDGSVVTAPMPEDVAGHFGFGVRRLILQLYHSGQMTIPRIGELLDAVGLEISERQLVRFLHDGDESFRSEADDVLDAGLDCAPVVGVDDTGARHKGRNAATTVLQGLWFCAFATTGTKSRINFFEILQAGAGGYRINAAALEYMRAHKVREELVEALSSAEAKSFDGEEAWIGHLSALLPKTKGQGGSRRMRPATEAEEMETIHSRLTRLATEGALWGALVERGRLRETLVMADGARQFDVGDRVRCLVHAERVIHRLEARTDAFRAAKAAAQDAFWAIYASLKVYRQAPAADAKASISAAFDAMVSARSGWKALDSLLDRMAKDKALLLRALERPEAPLHNNDSENAIRCMVTRRKISSGTRSDAGRDCRDAFLGLMKTCRKLGIVFWDYLGARLKIPGIPGIPPLADLIRTRYAEMATA